MSVLTSFFIEMTPAEQREWSSDLYNRINVDNLTNTSVCLLDTGVSNGHPILQKILKDKDCQTIDTARGAEDKDGHGTKMAGIAAFFTLEDKLETIDEIEVEHFLESVKMMDRPSDNPEELYGSLTAEAISLAEIENPDTNRAICMAITAGTDIEKDGRPSSWSGAIDSIISGSQEEALLQHKLLGWQHKYGNNIQSYGQRQYVR